MSHGDPITLTNDILVLFVYTWETLLDLVAELECDLMPYLIMFYVSCAWSYGYTHVAMAIPLMLLFFDLYIIMLSLHLHHNITASGFTTVHPSRRMGAEFSNYQLHMQQI